MSDSLIAAATIALNAPPLLAEFNRAGVLASADVQVAMRLGRLTGEHDERVLLAVGLAVRAVRAGSVCVTLDDLSTFEPSSEEGALAADVPWPDLDGWRAAIANSPLAAVGLDGPSDRPVRWMQGRLYLDRYWRDEQLIRTEVDQRLQTDLLPTPPALAAELVRLLPGDENSLQRIAIATAVLSRLTVITGGPGTGKTTTVAALLAVLQSVAGPGLRIALTAPTGKAAARLQEAVAERIHGLDQADQRRVGTPEATTVHRLLGWKPGSSTRFAHDRNRRLPHDVVIVDESSMVSLPLMARLLEAMDPNARLILVGDPDQLASVEAGAVLGDLVARPPVADALPDALSAALPEEAPTLGETGSALRNGVVRLTVVHRFTDAIRDLADAVRGGDTAGVLAALRAGNEGVEFVDTAEHDLTQDAVSAVQADAARAGGEVVLAARAGDIPAALSALDSHRLLLAHRNGRYGVAAWALNIEAWVQAWLREHDNPQDSAVDGRTWPTGAESAGGLWYPGRPLLVTANDRESGLYNGDTGVIVADGNGGLVAAFGDPSRPLRIRPHRLPAVETVYAMTVHRGQGSQFIAVTVVLPPPSSPLLTRELLYTAITRARQRVRVIGSEKAVTAALARPVRRASGLRVTHDGGI